MTKMTVKKQTRGLKLEPDALLPFIITKNSVGIFSKLIRNQLLRIGILQS